MSNPANAVWQLQSDLAGQDQSGPVSLTGVEPISVAMSCSVRVVYCSRSQSGLLRLGLSFRSIETHPFGVTEPGCSTSRGSFR